MGISCRGLEGPGETLQCFIHSADGFLFLTMATKFVRFFFYLFAGKCSSVLFIRHFSQGDVLPPFLSGVQGGWLSGGGERSLRSWRLAADTATL